MYNVMRNKDIFFSSFLFALICTKKSKPAYISCIVMFFFKLFILMETYILYIYASKIIIVIIDKKTPKSLL